MVQIAEARIRDEETGTFKTVPAHKFDKKTDGAKTCHCPDPNCKAVLTHYDSYLQTFYDEQTGEAFRTRVASHFKRLRGSPEHARDCTAVEYYRQYQHVAREFGGIGITEGRFLFNLNIPTDTCEAPLRQNRGNLVRRFSQAVTPAADDQHVPRKLSQGLNSAEAFADLLDKTAYNPYYRDSIMFRNGKSLFTLNQLYKNDPVKFFNEEQARAQEGKGPQPALIEFKPIAKQKFHFRSSLMIQGEAKRVVENGREHYVSIMLHCTNDSMYKQITKAIRAGERSFLIYSEGANVQLLECAQKKKDIANGTAKDKALYVYVPVSTEKQVQAWEPMPAVLSFIDHAKPAGTAVRQLAAE